MAIFIGEIEGTSKGTSTLVQRGNFWITETNLERSYYVLGTEAEREYDILSVSGIPALYSIETSGSTNARCFSRDPEEMNSVDYQGSAYVLWKVACKWNNNINQDSQQGDEEPTQRRLRTRWYGENEESQLYFDPITAKPIMTKAREFIYISHPIIRPILEITRYENPPFNPNKQLDYPNHTNLDTFYGAPSGCALMMPLGVEEEVIGDTLYLRVTYRIKFAIEKALNSVGDVVLLEDGWATRPLHEGNYEFEDGDKDKLRRVTFKDGHVAKGLLKSTGAHMEPTEDIELFDTEHENYPFLYFNRYPKADFNALSVE